MFIPTFTTNAITSDFISSISPGGLFFFFPRLPSYGVYISQLVRFARCCTRVLDYHSKHLQITSKRLTQGYRYHKLRKTFGNFSGHARSFYSKELLRYWRYMPSKDKNFNPRILGKCFYFVICMISRHFFQTKLLPFIV